MNKEIWYLKSNLRRFNMSDSDINDIKFLEKK